MLKPSEIIRMAMHHPSYLAEDGEDWLCSVLVRMQHEGIISSFEDDEVTEIIQESLEGRGFLRGYLYKINKIKSRHTSYQSEEYKQAAFEHWNNLIEKLEKEGR